MKLIQALVVRDVADVIEAHLDYHLSAGVDLVIVTDHESSDGTSEILRSYERSGRVRCVLERGVRREGDWRARMALLAVADHGADWLIDGTADEFWWPRGGSLKDVLTPVSSEFDVVHGFVRHFVPAGGADAFSERMIYRLAALAPIDDATSVWRPASRPVVRASKAAHDTTAPLRPLRGWHPLEVLHFPQRDRAEACSCTREDIDEGLAEGILEIDTRLRDAVRALARGGDGGLRFPHPTVVDDARFAVDIAVLGEADVTNAQRRMDELEQRVAAMERYLSLRLERRARAAVRRLRTRR